MLGVDVASEAVSQTPRTVYLRLGLSSSFLVNTAAVQLQFLALWVAFLALKGRRQNNSFSIRAASEKPPVVQTMFRLAINYMLLMHDNFLFVITLAIQLQFKNTNFITPFNTAAAMLAILYAVYYLLYVAMVVKEVNELKAIACVRLHQFIQRYVPIIYYQDDLACTQNKFSISAKSGGALPEGARQKLLGCVWRKCGAVGLQIQKNYHVMQLFKKLLLMVSLLQLEGNSLAQCYAVLFLNLPVLVVTVWYSPYALKRKQLFRNLLDIIYQAILCLVVYSEQLYRKLVRQPKFGEQ